MKLKELIGGTIMFVMLYAFGKAMYDKGKADAYKEIATTNEVQKTFEEIKEILKDAK